jgi:hypothetical protein
MVDVGWWTWNETRTINLQRSRSLALEDIKLSTRRFKILPLKISSCTGYNMTDPYVRCYIASKTQKSILKFSSDYNEIPIYQNAFMQATGLLMPFVSTGSVTTYLTSRQKFPNFIRIMQDTNLINPHVALIGRKLKYDKYLVFFQPLFGTPTLTSLLEYFDKTGLEIVNRDTLLQIDITDPDYFTKAAQLIKDSRLRPVFTVIGNTDFFHFTKAFDEVGLKDEDLVIIGEFVNYLDMIAVGTSEQNAVLSKYIKSYLFSFYTTYIEEKGQKVQDRLEKAFGNTVAVDCFAYDGIDLVVRALDFMINEDSTSINGKTSSSQLGRLVSSDALE